MHAYRVPARRGRMIGVAGIETITRYSGVLEVLLDSLDSCSDIGVQRMFD
jgi:hypothetical protein